MSAERGSRSGPADAVVVMESFLASYDAAVAEELASIEAGEPPTILRIEDELVLRHRGARERTKVTGREYEVLMRTCHIPAALALDRCRGRGSLAALADETSRLLEEADGAARSILEACTAAMARWDPEDEQGWGALRARVAEPVEQCIRRAAEIELEALGRATEAFLAAVGDGRPTFIVCAGHQPRYRQLTRLFFEQLVGEHPGPGARGERRLVYAENRGESEALRLLAAQRVDRDLALELWDDGQAMQEDLLGRAAAHALRRPARERP